MRTKVIVLALFITIVVLGIFIIWQLKLRNDILTKYSLACGGDWSYMNKCPIGSYCRDLGYGKLAGGVCTTYLDSLFTR
ncbi:hypothetical protein A2716_03185 [candidate division WWE3 bacterium RIFCSPHIGHO2_01_FULL_40_23]|uniref:Uncharacterized protein n=1 Tax=candidate division WWE3 bacterium RIFCSPLOWO2_01_FULL_41_18 TaxID=1802625 RepID=A0A1F4VCP0_UNCKA|nr:MAG: hypothetical protein A2716_03185 [candidate division WWE3 bacterium RIFCSPHIGHO2_01_FULL_40_23]OGC54887.1 MAG: hypothetical protein A3A78_02795 [candidate division WWE3 bacterium RIFCSPLOWO2_01_FULL_41_18]